MTLLCQAMQRGPQSNIAQPIMQENMIRAVLCDADQLVPAVHATCCKLKDCRSGAVAAAMQCQRCGTAGLKLRSCKDNFRQHVQSAALTSLMGFQVAAPSIAAESEQLLKTSAPFAIGAGCKSARKMRNKASYEMEYDQAVHGKGDAWRGLTAVRHKGPQEE